jgi:septal ring factor EnvC (AmiA/AmiB activator)
MRLIRRLAPAALAALAAASLLAASGCTNPRTQTALIQELNDAAAEINGLKNDLANLQTELDSMRTILAKHDTTISHIAAVNNIPIAR